jgi:hypothetical protein
MFFKIITLYSLHTKRWSVKLICLRYFLTFLMFISLTSLSAQDKSTSKVTWNGYAQLRFTNNFNDVNSFAMRRMKLWVKFTPEFDNHWGYKVQTTITSIQNEKFMLQDVEAFYQITHFKLNLGQFVPHYSLQRFQPDFTIPLTERAEVINALIPNGTLGARDIGIEGNYTSTTQKLQTWLGIFNGHGIKDYKLDNEGILLTQKTAFEIFNNHLYAGYSIMFRRADQLRLSHIMPDSVIYSGNDFRYNLFTQWHSKMWNVQAEYLQANLDGKIADGWYLLANVNLGKNQLVASWNKYNDVIESTVNDPEFHLGYNYLANGDKLKLMLDNGIIVDDDAINEYFMTLQLQLFFN